MWPFRNKYKDAFKKTQERDRIILELSDALRDRDEEQYRSSLTKLVFNGYVHDPLIPMVFETALQSVAAHDKREALGLATWLVGQAQDDQVRSTIVKAVLPLMEETYRAHRLSADMLSTVAMTAFVIADRTEADASTQQRALKQWELAVDGLALCGIQYAFAAASNATLASDSATVRELGLQKWENIIMQTDGTTAREESLRVMNGYDSFGEKAAPFKQKAAGVMRRLSGS